MERVRERRISKEKGKKGGRSERKERNQKIQRKENTKYEFDARM